MLARFAQDDPIPPSGILRTIPGKLVVGDVSAEARAMSSVDGQIDFGRKDWPPGVGHFDISDAWWALTAKGMQQISCHMARCTDDGHLELTGKVLRLCG